VSDRIGSDRWRRRIGKTQRPRRWGRETFRLGGRCGPAAVPILDQEGSGNVSWLCRWSIPTSSWPYHNFHNNRLKVSSSRAHTNSLLLGSILPILMFMLNKRRKSEKYTVMWLCVYSGSCLQFFLRSRSCFSSSLFHGGV
jgi:hypothetical protein